MRAWGMVLLAISVAGCIPRGGQPAPRYDPPPSSADDDPPPRYEEVPRYEDSRPPDAQYRPVAKPVAPPPAWEARPVSPDARVTTPVSYVVRPGESLGRVAANTGVSAVAIARANNLASPFTLRAGDTLAIPGGRYHLIRPGESGIAIARAYGVPWKAVVAANGLEEPYVLKAGQRLLIPDAGSLDLLPSAPPVTTGNKPPPPKPAAGISTDPALAARAAAFRLDVEDIITGGDPAEPPGVKPPRPSPGGRPYAPTSAVAPPPGRLNGPFLWPVDGRVVKRFGPGASGERNDGIKIAVPVGTPVRAAADGVVTYASDGIAALGGLVIVRHAGGWITVYGYASKLLVRRGQQVRRGQTIALSGDTGFADRPELHFELRKGRNAVDPMAQLPGR